METEQNSWLGPFRALSNAVTDWLQSLDTDWLIVLLAVCVAVFLLRRQLASLTVWFIKWVMGFLNIKLSDTVAEELHKTSEVLMVVFAVFIVLDYTEPADPWGTILHRVLYSIAVVAVFRAWYNLVDPFLALLRDDPIKGVRIEADWTQRVTRFAIMLFAITSLLKVWQIDISGVLTGVGVLGAGLAIAMQDLVRNLVSGMTNMSEQRFKTGDAISIDGKLVGVVRKIDLRSTLVVGFDEIPRHVPNSELSNSIVSNLSDRKRWRIYLQVPLLFSATADQVTAVRDGLKQYLETSEDFDHGSDAPQYVYVSDLGTSSVDIMFYAWTKSSDYATYLATTERLSLKIMAIAR